ncbi:MAG: M28 family peptidase [Sphingorhabdus sp.]|uniref:M28 family peptidase n=1 Tax=Sphingorhabdus sp. TaxID=1902408 RepID=UPI0038FD27DF
MRRYLFLPMVVAVALAIALITRVAPYGGDSTGYSFNEARKVLIAIASEPRPVGSVGHAKAHDWLVARLTALGLDVHTQVGVGVRQADFDNRRKGAVSVSPYQNIVAVIPGRDRAKKAVLLMAHYDSVLGANGAADNASGVSAVLETARILVNGPTPARDVIFLLTDAEEVGLVGAQEFFDKHTLAPRVGAVVNVEARGSRGRAIMFQTSPKNGELIQLWAKHAVQPTGNSLANNVYQLLPNDTDLSVPLKKGVTGINAAFINRLKDYHMPSDRLDNIDMHAVKHLGNFALTTTTALANAELLPAPASEAAYFDFFGLFVVRYPMWFGWILLAIGFGLLFTAKVERLGVRWRQALGGTLGVLALTVTVGLVSHVFSSYAYGNGIIQLRERINEMGPALWLFVALASSSVLLVRPREAMWTGSVILMLITAVVTQIWMPGASWLFDWGGLIGALLLNLAARSGWQSSAVIWVSAITGGLWGALLLTGVIITYDTVAPMTPAPVALIIPFAITLIGPVIMGFGNLTYARHFGAVLFSMAWLGAAWLIFDPSFSDQNPKPGDLFHYSDRVNGKNYWATSSTSRELPDGPVTEIIPPGFESYKWTAVPAPPADVALPEVKIDEQREKIVISMISKAAPRLMNFSIKPTLTLSNVRVNGKAINMRPGQPARIGWRAETPDAKLMFEFDRKAPGKLTIDYLYAVAKLPPGAPPMGGPDTDWTRFNGTRVVRGSINLSYGMSSPPE